MDVLETGKIKNEQIGNISSKAQVESNFSSIFVPPNIYITKGGRYNNLCEDYCQVQRHAIIATDKKPLAKPAKCASSCNILVKQRIDCYIGASRSYVLMYRFQ